MCKDSGRDEEHVVNSQLVKSQKYKFLPASVRKMDVEWDDFSNESIGGNNTNPQGFWFVGMCVIASVFQQLLCPSCKRGTLTKNLK